MALGEKMESSMKQKWKTVVLASLGGSLELYDFIIYGIFASEIAKTFFPSRDPIVSLLGVFSVFAVGYLARPLGGIILSSLGDRHGRRIVFLGSIFAMSLASIGIGIIPSYSTIGLMAPFLLVICRIVQGFCLAGELPCAVTYVVEEIPERAGLTSGTVIFGASIGVLLATLASFGIHHGFTPSFVESYGWRLAFLGGGVIGLASYWVRTTLEESQEFRKMKSHVLKAPFRHVLRHFPKPLFVGFGVAAIVNGTNVILFVVLPPYLTKVLGYDATAISTGQTLGVIILSASTLLTAWLSDRVPSRYLHRVGTLVFLFGGYSFFQALADHSLNVNMAFMMLGLAGGLLGGTYAFLLADLFPTPVRFSGVAFSLNLATVFFTGMGPLAITAIRKSTGLNAAPGLYVAFAAVVAIAAGIAGTRHWGNLRGTKSKAISSQPVPGLERVEHGGE